MTAQLLDNPLCHLGECPVWNPLMQKLFWTDILEGRIWSFDPATHQTTLVWESDQKVGGIAFAMDGGLVLCSNKGVLKIPPKSLFDIHAAPEKIITLLPLTDHERFNDITIDPRGRLFAGTKCDDNKNGKLWRIGNGCAPAIALDNVGISNGMTFSCDLRFFFHTDSVLQRITKYRYSIDTGDISNPAIFFQGTGKDGSPDGCTMDTEDHLWVAFWGASKVRRLDPYGSCVNEIDIPAIQPSSVMFGGRDLSDLYITSAYEGAVDLVNGFDSQKRFLGGHVYRAATSYRGRAEWLVDL